MSVINANPLLAAAGADGYQISRSVRFRASATAYFNRTAGTPTNNKVWTWSAWVKRGSLSLADANHLFMASPQDVGANPTSYTRLVFETDNTLRLQSSGSAGEAFTSSAVYRDASAWYHIVLSMNASSTVVNCYVNGVEISYASRTNPSNTTSVINGSGNYHRMGLFRSAEPRCFDGYMTEVNFIDGQALTPSSFGETDAVTGVWKPKKYAGTYGTNGFYLPFNVNAISTYAGSFNGSNQYIGITANAAFAFSTGNFTAECWFNSASAAAYQSFIDFWPSTSGSYTVGQWQLGTDNAGHLAWTVATSSTSAGNVTLTSSATYLANTWNHAAVVRNGTTVTLYLNGVAVGSTTFSGTVGASTIAGSLGRQTTSGSYLNGYLSNARVTNNAVYTSAFTPSVAPLTAISGTQLLTLQNATLVDNSTNAFTLTNGNTVTFGVQYPFSANVSADASGNGNHWTPNNVSLINNTTYDSMLDVPTPYADGGNGRGNYAVLNPLDFGANGIKSVITQGNLKGSDAGSASFNSTSVSTIGVTSGKFYCEFTSITAFVQAGILYGLPTSDMTAAGVRYYGSNGIIYKDGVSQGTFSTYTNNDVIGLALDADAKTIAFYKNNTLITTITYTSTNTVYLGALYPNTAGGGIYANFGQRPFTYTPPTGFKALNTQNLDDSPIKKGSLYFDAKTYSGNGTTQSISNASGFATDLAWIKMRSAVGENYVWDTVRGGGSALDLVTNRTNAEGFNSAYHNLAFTSTGFDITQIGIGNEVNASGQTYVAWQWKESASAGFDIVTYTGTGANRTVAHSLGAVPKMMIVKSRSIAENWPVYHASMNASPASGRLILDGTAAFTASSTTWQSTAPTDLVFSVGTATAVNTNGATYVAYLFSEVLGFSKFGSYTGNGAADGPFVYCGFRPRYILVKRTDAIADWYIYDTARKTYNVMNEWLQADTSSAENSATTWEFDLLANGFKVRNSGAFSNASGGTYIYAAFAENPFKNSLAR